MGINELETFDFSETIHFNKAAKKNGLKQKLLNSLNLSYTFLIIVTIFEKKIMSEVTVNDVKKGLSKINLIMDTELVRRYMKIMEEYGVLIKLKNKYIQSIGEKIKARNSTKKARFYRLNMNVDDDAYYEQYVSDAKKGVEK